MSYILEALKKAQAERQLGNAPTIHAPQPVQAAQPGLGASRKPLFIGLGAGVLVVAAGALFVWQRGPSPAAPVASTAVAQAPAVLAPSGEGTAAAPAVAPAPPPAVRAPAPKTVGAASNTLVVSAPPAPPPRPAHVAEPPAHPAPPAATAPRAAAAPPSAPAPEDSLPYLHQLPEAIQRDMPRVSFGGYMYSANPADRLLLVDKTLRHEGEEVAPGLVLEKLLPKAAVMNFRGVRYRVAY